MEINNFSFYTNSQLLFGAGEFYKLASLIKKYGQHALIIIGGSSLYKSGKLEHLTKELEHYKINFSLLNIDSEPTIEMIDSALEKFRNIRIDIVISIGGGSVIDAGKAISAMLTKDDSVKNYLEGIGTKTHDGLKIPFIAVPTTSGTGSEATKNAVISKIGDYGYKKSLRHDNFIPNIAIVDPELTISCPKNITASSGMDAFTQLLEAYVSPKGSTMTDALALEGLKLIIPNLLQTYNVPSDLEARSNVALASYLSGVVLSNAGLGVVHGFASSIGGLFNIPHGVICGTLIHPATKTNIEQLRSEHSIKILDKYARVGFLFSNHAYNDKSNLRDEGLKILLVKLHLFTEIMNIPKLKKYGVSVKDIDRICEITENKNNPIDLTKEDRFKILESRI